MEIPHKDFVALYNKGQLSVHVDQSAAMHVCDRHPKISSSTKLAHNIWKGTGCLLPIAGAAGLFFVRWYWALATIFLGLAIVIPAVRRSAAGFVLEAALADEAFYREMIQAKVISCTDKLK